MGNQTAKNTPRDERALADELQRLLKELQGDPARLEILRAQDPQTVASLYTELLLAKYLIEERELCDPRAGFIQNSRRRLESELRLSHASPAPGFRPRHRWFDRLASLFNLRLLYQAALLVCLIAVVVFGSLFVSQTAQAALPGQLLYPLKLTLENIQVATTHDTTEQAILLVNLSGKRLDELARSPASIAPEQVAASLQRYSSTLQRAIHQMELALQEEQPPENQRLFGAVAALPGLLAADLETVAYIKELTPLSASAWQGVFSETELLMASSAERAASLNETLATLVGALGAPSSGFAATLPGLRQPVYPVVRMSPTFTPTATNTLTATATSSSQEISASPTPAPTEKVKELPSPRPTNPNRPTPRPTNVNR
jgi:hypothetical protein